MRIIPPNARPNCGGNSFPTIWGGCFQHFDSSSVSVTRFQNETLVTDYSLTPNPDGIVPYKRWHVNGSSTGNCFPPDEMCCQDTPGQPCCELPVYTDTKDCVAGDIKVDNGGYWNCFRNGSPQTNSFTVCHKQGYKRVFSKKNWLGIYSYSSQTWNNYDYIDYCCTCNAINYRPTPDTTKYLEISATATHDEHNFDRDTGFSTSTLHSFANQAVHVDRYSGELIVDSCASGSDDPFVPGDFAKEIFDAMAKAANGNIFFDIHENFCTMATGYFIAYGLPQISGDGNAWTLTWETTDGCGDTFTVAILTVDLAAGTLRNEGWCVSPYEGGPCTIFKCTDQSWLYSGASFSVTFSSTYKSESAYGDQSTTIEGSLATPYTSQQAYQDAIDLLNKFPMDDDVIYPWKTDSDVLRGPLVHYDETFDKPALGVSCDPFDSTVGSFTGKILGLPLKGGYEQFWNQRFENWMNCVGPCDGGGSGLFWFINTYGNWNTVDIGIPGCTDWLNRRDADDMFVGSFVGMNFRFTNPACTDRVKIFDDVIWVSKYAEVQVPRPSYNYARPCFRDRFAVNILTSSCVQSFDLMSKQFTLLDTTNFNAGDTILLCGVGPATLNGLWRIGSIDSMTQLTLGQAVYTSSVNGGSIFTSSFDCGTGIIVEARFPNCPGICGRDYVTSNQNSPITCSLEDDTTLFNGDTVLVTFDNNNVIQATVIVLDANVVVLKDIPSGSAVPLFLACPHTPDPKWADDSSKGDFIAYEIRYDNLRPLGEYNRMLQQNTINNPVDSFDCSGLRPCPPASRPPLPPQPGQYQVTWSVAASVSALNCTQSCLAENPCSPSVIAILPPGAPEKFPGGKIFTMPSTFQGDSVYGNLWRMVIRQTDVSPIWTPDLCACQGDSFGANLPPLFCDEDPQAQCFQDTEVQGYYAYHDLVEARCAPPDDAPALPPGVYIGCLPLDKINIPTQPQGNICYPTLAGEIPDWSIPWVIFDNQETCICNSGRFANRYLEDTFANCEEEVGI